MPGGGYRDGYDSFNTTSAQNALLAAVPADRQIRTLTLPGLGDYRVTAVWAPPHAPTPDDPQARPGQKLVTGLSLKDVNNALIHLDITEICVAIAGLIAVGLVGESIIRRTLRPLRRVASIATRVSEMELDRGEVALSVRVPTRDTDPRTEVGQLGASLNRMLGHVSAALTARQASEVRVRKFVADASHELRTPLAAIRGYAELTRRVGGGTLPDDVDLRDGPGRERVGAHDHARRGSAAARAARRRPAARPLARRPLPPGRRRASATRTWPAAATSGDSTSPTTEVSVLGDEATPAPGDREPAGQRAYAHTPPARR